MKFSWMRMDSTGRESRTLFFVAASWLAVWVKYLAAGLTLPLVGTVPPMTATEFGMAVAAILGIWLGREWIKKGA
jgi:hypothetical protein